MKQIGIITLLISLSLGYLSDARAEDFEGAIVREVQVNCIAAPELVKLIRKNISIQPGEIFSQEKIRESIRQIYALKRFSQITVEGERVEGGVRLVFCPVQIKTISKIQITGTKAILADRVRDALAVNIGDQVPPNGMNALKQCVLKLYRDHGYPQVQVDIRTIAESRIEQEILAVDIQEGEPSVIRTITFSGQTVFTEMTLLKKSRLKPGRTFTFDGLEQGLERIKTLYAEKGYLNMEFTGRNLEYNTETGKADLQLTLTEGKPTILRFEGNTRINTKKLEGIVNIFTSEGLPEENLEENASAVVEYYQTEGFPFVNVTYRKTEEENAFTITFAIEEGPQVRVQDILIEGNQAFSTKQLRKLMFTNTGGLFSKGLYQEKVFQEDILAIKAFYRQNGYLEAEVITVSKEFSSDQTQVSLSLVIQEGIQTRVADIRILGESRETALKKIRKSLLLKNGNPFTIDDITQSIDRIKEFYANQGHIKANVDVSTAFNTDNSQITVTFTITPGKTFYIGKISIQGVIRTKKVFITRELKVKEGDVYNPQKIKETVRRLHQLGFYDNVTFRRLDPKSDHPIQDMLLAVSETSAKDVEFGVGYSTERELNGFVEYSDKNVFNFGGKGSARAELSVERPKITLQYHHPHLFTQDTNWLATVFDDIQKDNASFDIEQRGGRLAIQHNFSSTFSTSLGYYFQQADPSNVSEYAMLSEFDTRVLNWGGLDARLSWDIRDDVIQTKKGGWTQLYIRTGNNALGSEVDFFEVNAQSNWYLNPFRGYVLAFSLNGKMIEPTKSSEQVPIYARYFLGGESSVRGFPKYSIGPTAIADKGNKVNIGGDRMVRFNAELRFPIYSVLGGVIFYDAGANWLDAERFTSEDIRAAIGAGLRIATPVGPLRLDYGWKLDRQSGESAGEYYITIGSAF
jgi:outer membrane protein insertion porin family